MSQIIKNIALYLTPRLGDSTDWSLILTVYNSDHNSGGFPVGFPLGIAERPVSDITQEGWYIFDFNSLELDPGYYSIVLTQRKGDLNPDEDFFEKNFIEWVHSSNTEDNKQVYAFSSDYGFTTFPSGGNAYYDSYVYGYGYGYGLDDPLDYFNVLGFEGSLYGYGLGLDPDEVQSYREYSYGFEETTLISDINIKRNFKIYSKFNDITFDDVFDFTDSENHQTVFVNLPEGQEDVLTLSNRQDFVIAERSTVDVVGSYITLSDSGERVYSTDIISFSSGNSESFEVDWSKSNFFLSINDVNYADIVSPTGNTNRAACWLASVNYYSGAYFSSNSGSVWHENIEGLSLSDNSVRNLSCIKFDPDGNYVIAFDNTSASEKGKVYGAVVSKALIDLGDISWNLINSSDDGSGGLKGLVVNDALFFSENEVWVGTDNGVYKSIDKGISWSPLNVGLPASTIVNEISGEFSSGIAYGYGYGYGQGLDYFDVIGETGYTIGYGTDDFESDYAFSYGYGYGYEYTDTGNQSGVLTFIATESGVYRYSNGYWVRVGASSITQANTVLLENGKVYVGTDDGFFRSADEENVYIDGLTFEGTDEFDTFYAQGLLKNTTTKILSNLSNPQELFVSQYGGVFVSTNGGGNFNNISNKLPEKKVKFILTNPLNSRIIYAFTESTKFSNAAVTVLMDYSGSMLSNDINGNRIDMAKNIISQISSSATNTPFFQLVRFGLLDSEYQKIKSYAENRGLSEEDFSVGGIINITEGFTSSTSYVLNQLEALRNPTYYGNKTPLNEAINLISQSINQGGADFSYFDREYEYEVGTIISRRFKESDKILLIITDGFNSTVGKTLDYAVRSDSEFQKLRGKIYIISVGQNINYDYLNSLQGSRDNVYVYHSGFSENLDTEITSLILDREQFRERTGTWKKTINYNEFREIKSLNISANVPNGTSANYRVRASKDKDIWTDWTEGLSVNQEESVSLFGQYLQIEITINSFYPYLSPEIKNIDITTINPSENYLFYKSKKTDTTKEISDIYLNSLDDYSLGNYSEEEILLNFGFLESDTTSFDFYRTIPYGTRGIVKRKKWENLITEDGFFYDLEAGAWPSDFSLEIYDATDGIQDLVEPIASSRYFAIPSLGRVVFYEKQGLNKIFKAKLINSNSVYRIGAELKNYTDFSIDFRMYGISWMYYDDPRTTTVQRNPLPLVASQLGEGDVFGLVSPPSVPSSTVLNSVITAQYINRSEDSFTNGVISISNGLRINLSTNEDVDDFKFYKQNVFLGQYNLVSPESQNYVSVNRLTDNISVTASDSYDDLYQINTTFSSSVLSSNGSMTFVLGDTSLGGVGLATYFEQSNLLFDSTEQVVGELETTFIVGDSDNISTNPSIELEEGSVNQELPANDSDFNGFDKPLSPNISFGGSTAIKGVIIAPTTVVTGTPFQINVLAIDILGLIDRSYLGEFTIEFTNSSFGDIGSETYEFVNGDRGTKSITISTNNSVSGTVRIRLTLNNIESLSNQVIVNTSSVEDNIFWGDLNVSSVFSDGRQSIEFISTYARNVGLLNFVGIADDLYDLTEKEWDSIRNESLDNTTSELIVIPGVRHRSQNYYGERVVLFQNLDDIPETKITDPESISGEQSQIQRLVSAIRNYNSISFPIHTAYENDQASSIFKSRAFDFENYRDIISYSPVSDSEDFVYQKEVAVEVYSDHGGIERQSQFVNENFLIGQDSQYLTYALQMGKKFAFIANSGSYASRPGYYTGDQSNRVTLPGIANGSNRGLTAIVSSGFSRENIFSAIRNRRCYATTGAKIYLKFEALYGTIPIKTGTHFTQTKTNSTNATPDQSISFRFRALSDKSNISKLEIVKIEVDNFTNNRSIYDSSRGAIADYGSDTGVLTFNETEIANQGVEGKEFCYYLKVTQFDGHTAWSSPIWIDFGREAGIRSSSEFSQNKIFKVTLVESYDNNNFGIIRGAPKRDNIEGFPLDHSNIIVIPPEYDPKDTRATPYATPDDNPISLMASDKRSVFTGFRVESYSDFKLFYGTHFMKILHDDSEFTEENLIAPANPSIYNGDNYKSNYVDEKFKFLNEAYNTTDDSRRQKYRDWFFGTMWQYTSTTSFRTGYSFDKVYSPILPHTLIVKDPFIYRDGADYLLFYSGYTEKYPLQNNQDPSILFGVSPITELDPNLLQTLNKREEFVGLLDTNNLNPMNYGEKFKIIFANDDGTESSRTFLRKEEIPNTFGNGRQIYYSQCPNYIRVSNSDHRVYYLGWFYGEGSLIKPVLGLFCYRFSNIENVAVTGANVLCFAFTGDSSTLPQSYISRECSFEANSFYPSDIREEADGSDFWFKDHPVYGHRWYWLSVVQQDNGDFYAFFNFLNQIDPDIYTGQDNPGTGILYSTDADKLTFRQFDSTGTQKLPVLSGKVFFHPFKVVESSQTSWYAVYRNINSGTSDLSDDIFYARFNWIPEFSV